MSSLDIISAYSTIIEDPTLWSKRLPAKFAAKAPKLVAREDGLAWVLDGKSVRASATLKDAIAALPGVDARADLDKARWLSTGEWRLWLQGRDEVQGEVLYSTRGVWDLINAADDAAFVLACYQAYNDWIADLTAQDPDSLVGLARIPVTGVKDATAELKRASEKLKLRGAILDAWPDGFEGAAAGPDADPFWEAAAGLKTPISVHQGLSGKAETPEQIHFGGAPSYGFDLNAIVYGNVFDRYQNLRIVSAHPRIGWAPATLEGLAETYMRTAGMRKIHLRDDLMPNDYLRMYFWYVVQDDRFGLLNRAYFGDAHVMWGTFSLAEDESVWPNSRQLFERHLAGTPEATRKTLANDVVCRLYGLRGAKPFKKAEIEAYAKYALL